MTYEVRPWGKDQWRVERVTHSGARAIIWIEPRQDYADAVRVVLETEMRAWERELGGDEE